MSKLLGIVAAMLSLNGAWTLEQPRAAGDFGGRFDDAYLTLLPGRHTFVYRPGGKLDEASARSRFVLEHLQGARKRQL